MSVRRDWRDAVAHHEGRGCRVCLRWPRELAHVIPRTYDRRRGAMTGTIRVHPLAVVPLCVVHHRLYDSRQLDLTPHLKPAELDHAFSVIGRERTLAYVQSRSETLTPPPTRVL